MDGFDVATVGDNCIDRYLPPVGVSTVGGNAVNVAVHIRRRGHRVVYLGAVGDDANGERLLACLDQDGVETDMFASALVRRPSPRSPLIPWGTAFSFPRTSASAVDIVLCRRKWSACDRGGMSISGGSTTGAL